MKTTTFLFLFLFAFGTMAQEPVFNEKITIESTAFTTEKVQMKDGSYFFTAGHITGNVVTFHVYRVGPDGKKIFEISNKELGVGPGRYAMVYNKDEDDAILVVLGKEERGLHPVTFVRFENNNSHVTKTGSVKTKVASVLFTNKTIYMIGMVDIIGVDRTSIMKYDLHAVDYSSLEITTTTMDMPKPEEKKNTFYYSPIDVEGGKILFARVLSYYTDKATTMGQLNLVWYDIATNKASEPVSTTIDVSDKVFLFYNNPTYGTPVLTNALDVISTPLFAKNPKDGSYVFFSSYKTKTFPLSKSEDVATGDFIIKVSKDLKKEWMTFIPYTDKVAKNKDFTTLKENRKRYQAGYFTNEEVLLETNAAISKSETGTLLHHINKKDGKLVKTDDPVAGLLPKMIMYNSNSDFKAAVPALAKLFSGYQTTIATYDFTAGEKFFLIHKKETGKGYEIYAIPLKK